MIPRIPEPEVMGDAAEADEYDRMDHSLVNLAFVEEFRSACGDVFLRDILDVGTGTALIPLVVVNSTSDVRVAAVDRSLAMLERAAVNISASKTDESILLAACDSRRLPFADATFDAVMSNSLVHHLNDDSSTGVESISASLQEMYRVVKPNGVVFVRDLCRPTSVDRLESIVGRYAGNETATAQQLFRQSLHAALTVEELAELTLKLSFNSCSVEASSDRHWTMLARR